MAEPSSSIKDYFPNVKIRTMAKDLAVITQGGGVVQEPEKQTAHFSDFIAAEQAQQQTKPITPPTIAPPELSREPPRTMNLPQQSEPFQKTSLEQFMQQSVPPQQNPEQRTASANLTMHTEEPVPAWLWGILGIIGVVVIGSIGYWIVYPRIQEQLALMHQTPTPIPTQTPSITPAVDPSIGIASLPANVKRFSLTVTSTSSSAFLTQLIASFPSVIPSTGTLALYSFPEPQNTYLSDRDLVHLFAPNALPSFQASLDAPYLFFAYWYKANEPALGIVFTAQPGQEGILKPFMQGWETARIEQDFQNLYAPAQQVTRTSDAFSDTLIAGTPTRTIPVSKDGEPSQFIYSLTRSYLIITTNAKAFETVAKLLP